MIASPLTLTLETPASAQVVPDSTLGNESSVVTPDVDVNGRLVDLIEGGARRGANLFHSFQKFNISGSERIFFANPDGIENILSRVIGENPSNIFGTLGVDGSANLFLINPHGIVFGPNARLELAGSFIASTASRFQFGDGSSFSAINPQAPPLLTIDVPIGLGFTSQPAAISNQSQSTTPQGEVAGLQVPASQSLALVGGDLLLAGGALSAEGGRIELGAIAGDGTVGLQETESGLALSYEGIERFGNIQLSQGAIVDTSGVGGGNIRARAANVMLQDGSRFLANNLGSRSGENIQIIASESVELSGIATEDLRGGLFAEATGSGNAGSVTIETERFVVRDGAQVSTSTFGEGQGGEIGVRASESVQLLGRDADGSAQTGLFSESEGTGNGGNAILETGNLVIAGQAVISTTTFGAGNGGDVAVIASELVEVIGAATNESSLFTSGIAAVTNGRGNAGDVSIETRQLTVRDGAQLVSVTFGAGDGGNVEVNASESLRLTGVTPEKPPSPSTIASATAGTGDSGNVTINTERLILREGAQIFSSTFDDGNAGDVTVNASESIDLDGREPRTFSFSSGLFAQAQGPNPEEFPGEVTTGDGGNLTIITQWLRLRDGARISVGTRRETTQGDGGTLTIQASELIELGGTGRDLTSENGEIGSTLFSASEGRGNAGELTSIETDALIVRDGAEITVSSEVAGSAAGTLEIEANSIRLTGGSIRADTAGGQGNIVLRAGEIILRDQSQISTNAQGEASSGNLQIESDVLVGLNNSDITANAEQQGGRIDITAQGVFGFEVRTRETLESLLDSDSLDPSQLPSSDITAISLTDPQLSGQVATRSPEVDPSQGVIELPNELVDLSGLVARACPTDSDTSSFAIAGRGGLPPDPSKTFLTPLIWVEVGSPVAASHTHDHASGLVEARGWMLSANGNIVLSTNAPSPANRLLEQGRKHYQAGDFRQAIAAWQEAAAIFATQGDRLNAAVTLSDLALAYQQLGDWQSSRSAMALGAPANLIAKSQQLLANLPESSAGAQAALARVLNAQGSLQLAAGQAQAALSSWQQAETAYAATDNASGVLRSQIHQALALEALGFYRQAVTLLERAEAALASQPDTSLQAAGWLALGDALRGVGQLARSQAILERSLAAAQDGQMPSALAAAHLSLGHTARARGNARAAIEHYQIATHQAPTRLGQFQALVSHLNLLAAQQRQLSARALWKEIQSRLSNLPASRTSIYARINLAHSLSRLQPLGEAPLTAPDTIAALLTTAAEQAQRLGDQRGQSHALGHLGEWQMQQGQWTSALEQTQQALLLAQALRAPEVAYRWHWQLGRIYRAQGKRQDAIAAYQQAVNLLNSLRSELVASSLELRFSFRESVEPVYRELVGLLLQPEPGEKASPAKIEQALQVMESLQLAELDNFFGDACSPVQQVRVDRLDPNAATIHPIILDERIEVVVSLPGQPPSHYTVPISRTELAIELERLKRPLFEEPVRRSTLTDADWQRLIADYLTSAQQIYDWLLRPVEASLEANNIARLVFVLDGALRQIPMAALHDGQQYLIEKYAVALAPSLRLSQSSSAVDPKRAAIAGGLSQARQGFTALPKVTYELQQVQESLVQSQTLLNEQFTSAALKKALVESSFPIVHLATHGQFSSNAEETFILTWDERINANELDELLQASNPELLVLSACQTATGDERAALGLAGIATRAGAQATLATLWFVEDEATATLMSQFYRELASYLEMTKARALQRAQRALLEQPRFQHPLFWASFVLVGHWL